MHKLLIMILGLPTFGVVTTVAINNNQLPSPTTLIFPITIIIALVIINGLFVATEFSIFAVRANQVEPFIEQGHQYAEQLLTITRSPEEQQNYIATAQIGITFTTLILGMYGITHFVPFIKPYLTFALHDYFELTAINALSYFLAIILLSYLHVTAGEMVPRSIAYTLPHKTALTLFKPMRFLQKLLRGLIFLLHFISKLLLKPLNIEAARFNGRIHSPEELEQIVTESAEGGLLNQEEEEIILNIFDFGDRQVNQVMTPRPRIEAIPSNMPLAQILELVTQSKHSRFPVYQDQLDHKIIGILHVNDLVRHRLKHKNSPISETKFDLRLLLRPAPVVSQQYPLSKLLTAFRRQRIHLAIVIDEFGGTAGIVTLEDLMEEIVGEVRDEFDFEYEPFVEIKPGMVEVSGRYLLEDLADYITLGDPEERPNVETVGGLIMTQLGRPPVIHDQVSYQDINFTVLQVDGLAVARASVEFPMAEAVEEEAPDSAAENQEENR